MEGCHYHFLRHAEAEPRGDDLNRPLSEMGKRQAKNCALGSSTLDLIISSSARRAQQTAEIIRSSHHLNIPIKIVPELYLPQKNPDIHTVLHMLETLGSSALSEFHEKDREGAWNRYCEEAFKALMTVINASQAHCILIVAHANVINDLGLKIAPHSEELKSIYFAPCTGFVIDTDQTVCFHRF